MTKTSTNSNANLAPDGTPTAEPSNAGATAHSTVQRTADEDGVRENAIREAAYRRFEARGDSPGDEKQDWLEAQAEVDGHAA